MKKHLLFLIILMLSMFPLISQKVSYSTTYVSINELIHGTLYTPIKAKKNTINSIVVLIAGSGPVDRNGNLPTMNITNNSLKFLSQGLAKKGISVFSYDKRLFPLMNSKDFDESQLSFEDFINDAIDVVKYFQHQNEYSFQERKIIIAGHSEGSLIGMIAGNKTKIDAFISISGAANSIDVILEQQISASSPTLLDETKQILSELKKGNSIEVDNPFLQPIFRSSVQPYLISLLKYNPQEELSKLNCPVLIIGGTADFQIKTSEAELLRKVQPNASYIIIKNMNHVLKKVKNFQVNHSSYNNPSLPIAPELIKNIVTFVSN